MKVRRLTDEEGAKLRRLVRKGEGKGQADVVRYRWAMVVLGSASGNTVEVLARLVQTCPVAKRARLRPGNARTTAMRTSPFALRASPPLGPAGRAGTPSRLSDAS